MRWMSAYLCAVVLGCCLGLSTYLIPETAQAQNVTIEDEKPRTALIPFAHQVSKSASESAQFGAYATVALHEKTRAADGTSIKLRGTGIGEHLVLSHKCPRWVVEYYASDYKALARIHEGYDLHFLAEETWSAPNDEYKKQYKLLRVTELKPK